jgi:hypothetical protein
LQLGSQRPFGGREIPSIHGRNGVADGRPVVRAPAGRYAKEHGRQRKNAMN